MEKDDDPGEIVTIACWLRELARRTKHFEGFTSFFLSRAHDTLAQELANFDIAIPVEQLAQHQPTLSDIPGYIAWMRMAALAVEQTSPKTCSLILMAEMSLKDVSASEDQHRSTELEGRRVPHA